MCRDSQIGQYNRTESPEIRGNQAYDARSITEPRVKRGPFNKWCWHTARPQVKNELINWIVALYYAQKSISERLSI